MTQNRFHQSKPVLFYQGGPEKVLNDYTPLDIIFLLLEGHGFPPSKQYASRITALKFEMAGSKSEFIMSQQPYFTLGLALRFPAYFKFAEAYVESYKAFLKALSSDKLFSRNAFLGIYLDTIRFPLYYPKALPRQISQAFGDAQITIEPFNEAEKKQICDLIGQYPSLKNQLTGLTEILAEASENKLLCNRQGLSRL
ncbi:MAG: hypothetical protein SFW66_01600 [Gammaproteobacteria bacterium]|nr:hypothetical protein [Gammaproteobacteria bacterium]